MQTLAREIRHAMKQVYYEKCFALFLIENAENKGDISVAITIWPFSTTKLFRSVVYILCGK